MHRLIAITTVFLMFYAQLGLAAGAHIHGQGDLDVALDGTRVEVLLIAPLSDLRTEAAGGPAALAERGDLFAFEGTDCGLVSGAVTSADIFEEVWFEDEADEQPSAHHHHNDGHDQEAADHRHDHDDGHGNGHGHGDNHHQAHDKDNEVHSDSYITWIYRCSAEPETLNVLLFEDTRLERIRVQAASATGAKTDTLSAGNNTMQLP